ncbi:hypothetical protein C8P63_11086 [Melghirimyces profundicolus]|uniref:Uncharacterized protein n=1 Tax=Melghirimyces profundicolus TaxID=1242148 RepID=A0A2T6BV35_9BACL|nr:hypothetical protein [Melghirimyces profundicolus]PTX59941.1 hypothetical protein C8P63_11086 [Melghirimyces profundicolus]
MNESVKNTLVQALLVTVIAINLMLAGVLAVRSQVQTGGVTPAMARPGSAALQPETRLEYQGTTEEKNWRVEHYRKVEVFRDEKGREVKTRPTDEEIHIRYWRK